MDKPIRTTIAKATESSPRNDSATVVELHDGSLFLAWMEFTESELKGADEAPNHIASMISTDGGNTWTDKRIEAVASTGDISVYNPSLLRLADDSILFHYFAYNKLEWQTPLESTGYLSRSTDECKTFSAPEHDWIRKPYHHASNTHIQLRCGRIIHAVGKVPIWGGPKDNQIASSRFSDDNGSTWVEAENNVVLPLRGAMEPHLAELEDNHLIMVVRTQIGGPFAAHSYDGGTSWSKPQMLGLTGCESMPVITYLPSAGDLLIVWNNSEYDPAFDHFGKRTPLSTAISTDSGASWRKGPDIESDPTWEFSNPAINLLSGDRIITTYFASEMENPHPPGKLGRSRMSLRGFIAPVDWFYALK